MVHGIGTDILDLGRIKALGNNWDDPFFQKTFTEQERDQAAARIDPEVFFATRFAAKESVFKCLGMDNSQIRLNDIEISNNEFGVPRVCLLGDLKEIADLKGVKKIHLSLSWDGTHALAFAVAESDEDAWRQTI